ncbi:MAG: DNA-binding protein Alba, partial [Candidatus Bathyarchaeota archaeon]
MSERSNIVYIGSKPVMSYVLAVMAGLSNSNSQEIVLKARGRAISTAVDVAEVSRRKFIKELETSNIVIGTEEIQAEEGGKRAVSTIEIVMSRKGPTS